MIVIVWFRQDLRLHDQAALLAAAGEGGVVPVYVLDDDTPGDWRIGGAQRWWLHHSLSALDTALRERGSRLVLRRGPAAASLAALAEETGASRIHAIRHYEPWWRAAEAALGERLCLHDGNHLARVEDVTTGAGKPYRIFSSFWKALTRHLPPDAPRDAPAHVPAPDRWPRSDPLADCPSDRGNP